MREITSLNMSVLLLKSISLKNNQICQFLYIFLMGNDDVITVMSHHFLIIVVSYVRHINIHILLNFLGQKIFQRVLGEGIFGA